MWILRWIIMAVIVIVILIFSLENLGSPPLRESLGFTFLGLSTPELPVILWLAFSFFAGVLFFMVFAFVRELKFRAQISRLKWELKSCEKELGVEDTGVQEGDKEE